MADRIVPNKTAKAVSAKPGAKRKVATKPAIAPKAAMRPAVAVKPPVAKPPIVAQVAAPKPVAAASAEAPKPVAVEPVKVPEPAAVAAMPQPVIAEKPVEASVSAVAPIVTQPVEPKPAPVIAEGKKIMNETLTQVQDTAKTFAADAQARATAMFGDMDVRAKSAMEKGSKAVAELVEFSKGNLEALAASGRVAAKGAEEIAKYSAEYGRATVEKANATAKKFAAVKSPTEFFQLQNEIAKTSVDEMVAQASKFSESYLKLLGEIAQPISNRVAVAAEKVKTAVAA